MWSFPTYLEAGQVLAHLPRSDLLVVAGPLVALHTDEVVDVVLVAPPPERFPEYVVALEFLRCLLEVGRQRLEPARAELVVGDGVQVLAVRVAGVEARVDPVEPGRKNCRRRQVGIARAVDGPVLDAARTGNAEHLRPVVVAVGNPDRRPGRAARR